MCDLNIELQAINAGPTFYSFKQLQTATENFSQANKLGEGGFGPVYKGSFPDGSEVAVKQLSATSKQGKSEFINEVTVISGILHKNLVKLRGCCIDGVEKLLVYEYLQKKSLDYLLFDVDQQEALNWPTRFNILVGTASGLAYLHEECHERIVHRDIKASNILLDSNFQPKIADFGLAKLVKDGREVYTRIVGTIGYVAPEYAMHGELTEKADVFSFGILVLEVVAGRANTDPSLSPSERYLLYWAWKLYEESSLEQMVDPKMYGSVSLDEVMRVIKVALMCSQAHSDKRPSMNRVKSMILGDIDVFPTPMKPEFVRQTPENKNSKQSIPDSFSISSEGSYVPFLTESSAEATVQPS